MTHHFDVAIVGAGPAGASTAICLSESNLRVALIDKAEFPRDKVCGDGLTPDVYNQLKLLPGTIGKEFQASTYKQACDGLKLFGPYGKHTDIAIPEERMLIHTSRREDLDNLLFTNAAAKGNVTDFQGAGVDEIRSEDGGHTLELSDGTQISAKMVVGADGAHSVVASKLGGVKMDRNHHFGGLRVYYENISDLENSLEIYYLEELLPAYLWIFPLPNNRANVGLGMSSAEIAKKKVNLRKVLKDAIANHPVLSKRFENAVALETIKGMGLPVGSRKLRRSGDGYLLLGDAGYLINPLTGEGVANAIRSGRIAAEHLINAFKANRFDSAFNKAYDAEIKRRMGGELRLSAWVAKRMFNKRFINFSISYVLALQGVHNLILAGFTTSSTLRLMRKPSFYLTFFKKVA